MRAVIQSLIRLIFWPIGILAGLLIAASIALYLFFNPNNYKPQISAFLQNQTNLPLIIEGDMHFTLFPWIGLKVEKLSLENLATIQELDLKISLPELLTRNLVISSLAIKDAHITLIKDKDGKMNWESAQHSVSVSPKKEKASHAPSAEKKFSFALKHFDVKNTKVIFTDKGTKQTWVIDHLDLSGNYSSSHAIPLKATFDFSLTPFKKETLLTAKTVIDGTILFHGQKPIVDLKTKLSFDLPGTTWEHTQLHAQLKGDLAKELVLQSLTLQSGKVEATGNVTLPIATLEPIVFSLKINDLDLDKLKSLSSAAPRSTTKTKAAASPSKSAAVSPPSTIAGRVIEGEVIIDRLQYDKYRLTNVKTSLRKQGETMRLYPFTATFYNGKLNASITQTGMQTHFKGSLVDLPVQPLLRALDKPEKLSGQATIDFNLSQANDNLEGVIKCKVNNGIIQGIDVNYYIGLAQSLIKKQNNTEPDTKQTPFDALSATLMLHDNIIDNNDLNIVSHDFSAKAEGSVYLTNQTLAYKLQANKIYHDGKEHPNAYPLAIRIKGPIQNPKIEPDLDVYLKKITDVELKKQIDKHVIKNIDKLLGKKDSATSENESEQNIGSKVEKEIGRGLKKILKFP